MFIEDLRNDFYNVLLGNRVLLLVHYDVDAICTCKILQGLFKSDNISYTLVPVGGISELKTAYEENNEEIKYVVLVNCGGTVDLVDILQPEEDVVFFVLDAHKPTDVCNVYSDGQIRLVYKDREENIPEFDDIFRDDEEEDEDEQIEGGREGLEAVVERRRARRAWEERRNTLMFNYTQFSYYGKPSACVALELCWRLSRSSVTAVWASGVALSAGTRERAQYALDTELLQLARGDVYTSAKIVLEKDLTLPLYRWWSVESALRYSPTLGPHLKLHTLAGATRLRQLLADMGFPLSQARQAYRAMDVELRRCLLSSLEACYDKYKLPEPTQASFLLNRPHSPVVAALDVVYAIMGLIEHSTLPKAEGFQHALAALDISHGENPSLRCGVLSAQMALENISKLVNSILASRQLHLAGPFSYFIVPEESALSRDNSPLWVGLLGRWMSATRGGGGGGGGGRPVVVAAERGGHSLVVGVPPHGDTRNLFGAAFEQAAAKSGVSVSMDFVDSSIITLPTSQRTQFLDALTALLA